MKYTARPIFERPLVLSNDECHVWLWSLMRAPEGGRDEATLSVFECAAASRFIFAEDRAKYIFCHKVVRAVLGAYTGCSPAFLDIAASSLGKPVLLAENAGFHFSLSHTSTHAILAVAHSPVGADLEHRRPIEPLIAEMHFSQVEQQRLARYVGEDWNRCFFRCWTRKEAILKAEGIGLNVPLASFDVEIADDRHPTLLSHRHDAGLTCEWLLHDISPSQELIAALAVHPHIRKVQCFALDSACVGVD